MIKNINLYRDRDLVYKAARRKKMHLVHPIKGPLNIIAVLSTALVLIACQTGDRQDQMGKDAKTESQYLIIDVERLDTLYRANIYSTSTARNTKKLVFESSKNLPKKELTLILLKLGFHQRDIYDAFAIAEGKGANQPHLLFEDAIK